MRRPSAITTTPSSLAVALALTFSATIAEAAPDPAPDPAPPPAAPPTESKVAAGPLTIKGSSPKRALPAYHRPAPDSAGDALLWVPRVALFPLYFITEYALRQPLGALVRVAEKGNWVQEISNLLTFGPTNNIGVIPTALIDFGLRSSVGVYFFYDDFLAKGNQLRAHAATGGSDWLRLTVADRIPIDEHTHLKLRFEASARPDQLFYGIGPRSLEKSGSIYGLTSYDGSALFHLEPAPYLLIEAQGGVRSANFDAHPSCCGKTPIFVRAAFDGTALPPGFERGYTALRQGLFVALDSRRPRPDPGTGIRFAANLEHDFDLRDPGQSRWIKYGGEVGGYLDIGDKNRVLSLSLTTRFVDPTSNAEVPFTELVALGGDQVMFGYLQNRLIGRSAAAAVLEYRYPIWAFLDGSAQVVFGNVFGPHLDDFSPKRLRVSFDFGLRTTGSRDHSFNVLIGSGTETFEDGAKLNALRFMLGASRGF
ncbi:MAG: BamA/TamA family outer membrane protein [Minicystis sp.]